MADSNDTRPLDYYAVCADSGASRAAGARRVVACCWWFREERERGGAADRRLVNVGDIDEWGRYARTGRVAQTA